MIRGARSRLPGHGFDRTAAARDIHQNVDASVAEMPVPFGHADNLCRIGNIAADEAGAPAERSDFGATGSIAATSQAGQDRIGALRASPGAIAASIPFAGP